MQTWIQRAFRPLKRVLPRTAANAIRVSATAFFTPFYQSYRSGHLLSSFRMRAVDRRGNPLPWYAYPCIDLLRHRSFAGRRVLELGAGQSTIWWASVSESVLALEGDAEWYSMLRSSLPPNAEVQLVSPSPPDKCCDSVAQALEAYPDGCFDIIVIDGLCRARHLSTVLRLMADDGAIILDDSSGYHFHAACQKLGMQRVDFFGMSPGVVLRQCTSVLFRERCFLFDPAAEIADPAVD